MSIYANNLNPLLVNEIHFIVSWWMKGVVSGCTDIFNLQPMMNTCQLLPGQSGLATEHFLLHI